MMRTVAIPDDHFRRNIRVQYSEPDSAIVREALQNSIDAGATSIQIVVGDNFAEFHDDGSGMTAERLEEAMLTMGGSVKEAGSVGGFGAAKELLLFAHDHYFIHSMDNVVNGSVLRYSMEKGEARKGTLIRIFFHESYKFNRDNFICAARKIMIDSQFSIPVTLNGETVAPKERGRCIRAFPWGKVHCTKLENDTVYYAIVRMKGLIMFRQYIGATQRQVIIEVTSPSREVFTSNRDGFVSSVRDEAQRMFNELVIDRKSFGRKANSKLMFAGDKGAIDEIAALAPAATPVKVEEIMMKVVSEFRLRLDLKPGDEVKVAPEVPKNQVDMTPAQPGGFQQAAFQMPSVPSGPRGTTVADATEIVREIATQYAVGSPERTFIEAHAETLAKFAQRNAYDFVVHLENTRYSKLPKRFDPLTMGHHPRTLAKLWKRCLKVVLAANGLDIRFRTGWVLNDEEGALYVQKPSEYDDHPAFLLNPEGKLLGGLPRGGASLAAMLIVIAAHEVTHIFHTYHDEEFSTRNALVMAKTLAQCKNLGRLAFEAREEKL